MKLTIEGPENPKLIEKIANGEKVSLKGYKVFIDNSYEKQKSQQKNADL